MAEDKKEKEFLSAYEKYADDIYRHCYFRVYQKELAEDLTQETFTKTWKYISEGKDIKNIRAFLYRTAVNLIIDNSRKKKAILLDNLDPKEINKPARHNIMEEEIFSHLEEKRLVEILEELNDEQKQAIIMRYVDGFKPAEIADILGLSPNIASLRINRGLHKIREIIEKKYRQKHGE